MTGGLLTGRGGAFAGAGLPGGFSARRRGGAALLPAGPALVPLDADLVTIGDSITSNAFAQNDPYDRAYAASGFVTWLLAATAHRLRVRPNGNLAVGGNTLPQIRDSLGPNGAVLADRAPGAISFMGGTNHLNDSWSDAQLTSVLGQILTLLFASSAGLLIVWGVPPARPSAPRTANAERQRRLMNAFLASQVAGNEARAVFVDTDRLGLAEDDFADAVHPNASGARKLGLAGAALVGPRLAAGYVSALPALAAYTANPILAGGQDVATGWTKESGASGGATVAFSKDGTGRQRILVSGASTGTGRNVSLDQYTNVSAIGSAPAEGSILEGLLDYEIVGSPAGINALDVLIGMNAASYANQGQAQSILPDGGGPLFPAMPGRNVIRTIGVLRKAGPPNFVTTRLIVALTNGGSAVPVSLDLRVNRLEFRRVG